MSQTEDEICERLGDEAVELMLERTAKRSKERLSHVRGKMTNGIVAGPDGDMPRELTKYPRKFPFGGGWLLTLWAPCRPRYCDHAGPSQRYLELMGADLGAVPYGETL